MNGLAVNGNRAARRATGQGRPYGDLLVTRDGPFVFVGLRGSGFVRLTANQAHLVAALLTDLAELASNPTEETSS
ncbi:MAG: hypothetical protein ACRDZ3_20880 [Acidimicrobiia bacterium]